MRIITSADADWDDARVGRMFNGRRPDRQPEAIVVAASVDDVVEAVKLAKERGWTVAVRSGGHAWAGWPVRDGGLLIDLGALTEMDFDEVTGIATAQPAVQGGGVLSPFLESKGRFFNGGHCPSVGVGGFLLQGGQGWCQRGWGWAAESVVAVDVVTADGELLRCDAAQNADLYWAARGAGPSFPGIVVRFHLATRPIFGHLAHTVQLFELEEFTEVMTWLYGVHHRISPDVEIVVVSLTDPESGTRRFVVTGVALAADEAAAREALAPFNENPALPRAVMVQDAATSTMAEQRAQQEIQNPEHARYLTDNIWVQGDTAEIVKRIRPLFTDLPSPEAFTIWMSNAPMRDLPDMAFSLQTEAYVANYLVYRDAADDDRMRAWQAGAVAHAQPVTAGQYLGDSDMTNRQLKFMDEKHFERLRAIIADRDPNGRFHRYLAADDSRINVNHWEV